MLVKGAQKTACSSLVGASKYLVLSFFPVGIHREFTSKCGYWHNNSVIFDQQMLKTVYYILPEYSQDSWQIAAAGKCTEMLTFSCV